MAIERRKRNRPTPPRAPTSRRLDSILDRVVINLKRYWVGRLIFAGIIASGIGVAFWSISQLHAQLDASNDLYQRFDILQQEVFRMKHGWNGGEYEEVIGHIDSIERGLFSNSEELIRWLINLGDSSKTKGIYMEYAIRDKANAIVGFAGASMVPVDIQFRAVESINAKGHTYQLLLENIRRVLKSQKRVDLVRAEMKGNGRNAEELQVTLRLWIKEG